MQRKRVPAARMVDSRRDVRGRLHGAGGAAAGARERLEIGALEILLWNAAARGAAKCAVYHII